MKTTVYVRLSNQSATDSEFRVRANVEGESVTEIEIDEADYYGKFSIGPYDVAEFSELLARKGQSWADVMARLVAKAANPKKGRAA